MKKIKVIGILVLLIIGVFAFKQDVYADWIEGYLEGKIEFNIYNEETNQFEKYEKVTMFLESGNGILEPYIGTIKDNQEVYVIDNKILLTVPEKEGYYFSGWYLDENFENSLLDYKVDKPLKELELKLYGKWVKDKPNNKTYTFGKDVFSIGITSGCDWYGCGKYGDYIYLLENKTMVNEKEELTDLPSTLTSKDDVFVGWYHHYDYVSCEGKDIGTIEFTDEINSINELIASSDSGYIRVTAKWQGNEEELKKCKKVESTTEPTDQVPINESTNTIGATEETKEEDKDENMLIYGLAGLAGGMIVAGVVAAIILKKQSQKTKQV